MGRKKGKQSGSFGSKLNRSKYVTEVLQQQYENCPQEQQRGQRTKRRPADSILSRSDATGGRGSGGLGGLHLQHGSTITDTSSSSKSSSFSSSSFCLISSKPRQVINLNPLRGLLRERILEDRLLDATQRRARLLITTTTTTTTNNSNTTRSSSSTKPQEYDHHGNPIQKEENNCLFNEIQNIHAGWLLTYDHRAAMAGIDSKSILSLPSAVQCIQSSLEDLTLNVLASVMREYVNACGVDYMHARVSELPGNVIAKLSSKCPCVTDDIAYILGHHSHVDRLVLNGSEDMYHFSFWMEDEDENENEMEEEEEGSSLSLTTKGLCRMIHAQQETCDSEQDECISISSSSSNNNNNNDDEQVIDSWEHLSLHNEEKNSNVSNLVPTSMANTWSNNLQRLELRYFHPRDDGREFIGFLMKCSNLTHLSLAHSLNSMTGPRILLWLLEEDVMDVEHGTKAKRKSSKTILDVLPKLQVLDLHGCQWLHLDLLEMFLDRILQSSPSSRSSLELICIGGCSSYVSQACPLLNSRYGNATHDERMPLLCISPP
jgi:hypothetical protein